MLPVAIPDFVVGLRVALDRPDDERLLAATLVMTLGHLSAGLPARRGRAAPRRPGDGGHRPQPGRGPGATFVRVTLPLIRTAVLGGCVLVVLTVISEYGAFEILRYQTFTTEIFTEFQFDSQAAGALSVPLVLLGLLVLGGRRDRAAAGARGSDRAAAAPQPGGA